MRWLLLMLGALAVAPASGCDARRPETAGSTPPAPEPRSIPDPEGLTVAEEVRDLLRERTRAARAAPEDGEAWMALGMAYDAHQLYEQAAPCYERATRLEPELAKAWYHLARVTAELGDVAAALELIERALARSPDYAPAHWRAGTWLLDLGRTEEAEASFRKSLELDPEPLDATIGLARAELERARPDLAIPRLEAALEQDPDHGHARQLLGAAYRDAGRIEEAERELAASSGSPPAVTDPWAREVDALGVALLDRLEPLRELVRRGEAEAALPELEDLVRAHPTNLAVISTLTPAYVQLGRLDEARRVNERALAERGDHFRLHMNLSLLAAQSGNGDEALAHAERVVQLDPSYAAGHVHLGRLLVSAGRPDEAVAPLERALATGRPDLGTAMTLARVLVDLRRGEAAASLLERTARDFPAAADPRLFAASILADLGRLERARELLTEARELEHDERTWALIDRKLSASEEAGR